MRRRAEEARRAAQSGSLEVLIGYDLRFWRELSGLVGNTYISEFLHRIRIQCWVFSVPHLQKATAAEMRRALWDGHGELVDAVTRADAGEVRRIVHAYNQHGLDWAMRPLATPDRPATACGDGRPPRHGAWSGGYRPATAR